jgi:hypothetical protein
MVGADVGCQGTATGASRCRARQRNDRRESIGVAPPHSKNLANVTNTFLACVRQWVRTALPHIGHVQDLLVHGPPTHKNSRHRRAMRCRPECRGHGVVNLQDHRHHDRRRLPSCAHVRDGDPFVPKDVAHTTSRIDNCPLVCVVCDASDSSVPRRNQYGSTVRTVTPRPAAHLRSGCTW